MRRQASWLLCTLVAVTAGCLSPSSEQQSPQDPEAWNKGEIGTLLLTPMVVNETKNGVLIYRLHHLDDKYCLLDVGDLVVPYVVYDRSGLREAGHWAVDFTQNDTVEVQIDLVGTPPFVVAGQPDLFCFDVHKTEVDGVSSGFMYGPLHSNGTTISETFTTVTIPKGAKSGSTEWSADEFDYNLVQTWYPSSYADEDNPVGEDRGTLRVHDPLGRFVREHGRHLLTGNHIQNGIVARLPGEYRVDVELENPALSETRWAYGFQTLSFLPPICHYGLEWSLCDRTEGPSS